MPILIFFEHSGHDSGVFLTKNVQNQKKYTGSRFLTLKFSSGQLGVDFESKSMLALSESTLGLWESIFGLGS